MYTGALTVRARKFLLVSADGALVAEEVSETLPPPALDKNEEVIEGLFWAGFGTVGRVHSRAVNGRANDLNYIIKFNKFI